jgi:hypothetical protein
MIWVSSFCPRPFCSNNVNFWVAPDESFHFVNHLHDMIGRSADRRKAKRRPTPQIVMINLGRSDAKPSPRTVDNRPDHRPLRLQRPSLTNVQINLQRQHKHDAQRLSNDDSHAPTGLTDG